MVGCVKSYRYKSVIETIKRLNKEDCAIIAGGTDLMVLHKSRRGALPEITKSVVFIDHLSELKRVYSVNQDLHIGACCTYSELLEHPLLPEPLKNCIKTIAAPAIRNRGTLGGNICNASPAGDTLPLLYVYNTKLLLRSVHGDRVVAVSDFIKGPRRIQRNLNELLVEIILPAVLDKDWQIAFEKVGNRNADAIAKVSFAGLLQVSENRIVDARFAFGAVGPTILRSIEIEQKLIGKPFPLTDGDITMILTGFEQIIRPIDDQRSTAVYRKTVALNLLRYFLSLK